MHLRMSEPAGRLGIATVKSADQVTIEAGNSPSIIFKRYRELTTEKQADKWFGIVPHTCGLTCRECGSGMECGEARFTAFERGMVFPQGGTHPGHKRAG